MWILIIGLIVLTAIAMAVGYARNKKIQKKIESGELQAAPEIVEADAECCGQHEICEKESLLAAVSKKVEYYDDEELDRFRGHSSDGYSEEEIEEFREVMYTCKEDEEVFILGGATLYTEALPLADCLYLTEVDDEQAPADAFFPEVSPELWKEKSRECHPTDEKHLYSYSFVDYERTQK